MSTDFAMDVPLLLLKNTVDGFLTAEFRIKGCFPKFSTHSVRVVPLLALMFHLNVKVNKMWMKLKTFYRWYSVALLPVHEEFLCVSVFHRQECGEHYVSKACVHFTYIMYNTFNQQTMPYDWNFVTG
jgi:hypothetical protein